MSKARLICRLPVVIILLVLLGTIALSSIVAVFVTTPRIETLVMTAVEKYDTYLPEIRIRDGHASIREKQPNFVDLGDKELAAVIDTREGKQKEGLDYLKDVSAGFVLTRDTVIIKNSQQVRIIPLKDMPDFVVNSATLRDLVDQYWPLAMRVTAVLVVLYFLFAKPFQVLMFALIPYFGARFYKLPLTYGEALKISVIALIPPVLLDVTLTVAEIGVHGEFMLYLALYVALLIIACVSLVKGRPGESGDRPQEINP
jgi:hypothetical protein